ncbi:MAG: 3-oxoacyl-[acyl-carrier protein] reductase [uncultured Thermomicrobiales bacterium]|uniref:3-oxoacyl-[acyl-carrier protein] reductase n=1 Tax=uncultured Thermomicrobiales bacterium TaxID=1645740 RepID=A0A6J4UWH0_9BACT|nr:MAG: 3-oxoacyl-[acyl-carrier protein] reductase [uncultured Thermomicrobiales bacterium]
MDLQLHGKVAVVTGASRGIGLAVAAALAEAGAKVVAGSRTSGDDLALLAERYPIVAAAVDLTTPDGPATLVERAVLEFGALDILVNNVGGGAAPRLGGFLDITDEDWRQMLDLNLLSVVRASRAALSHLIARGGAIVNIATVNARLPQTPVLDYSASKAAVLNLTKALAEEFGPQDVRVNAVSPGPVRTPLWEGVGSFGDIFARAMGTDTAGLVATLPAQAGITLGRFAEPAEVADLVLFLASARSGMVTGADYVIDGGLLKTIWPGTARIATQANGAARDLPRRAVPQCPAMSTLPARFPNVIGAYAVLPVYSAARMRRCARRCW